MNFYLHSFDKSPSKGHPLGGHPVSKLQEKIRKIIIHQIGLRMPILLRIIMSMLYVTTVISRVLKALSPFLLSCIILLPLKYIINTPKTLLSQ